MTNDDASNARERFSQSPLGTWASYLGGGNDMHLGMKVTFHAAGTGTLEEWGFDHQHLNPAHLSEPVFQWRTVGDRRIEITYSGETRSVSYDFKITENEYGVKELRIFEPGLKPNEYGDVGFWISPFSLVYRERGSEVEKSQGIIGRLWERLTGGS
jgi:hypothetical protein